MQHNKKGFSLIELAIVLSIIGIIMGMGLHFGPEIIDKANRDKTKKILTDIESALVAYQRTYGHLPCPASRNLAISDGNFGKATTCSTPVVTPSTEGVIDVDGTTDNEDIRIGMVPVKELGLPANYALDAWNHKITYAAIKALVDAATYNNYATSLKTGVIQIKSEVSGTITQITTDNEKVIVAYALVSHGRDGVGSYANRASSSPVIACSPSFSNLKKENCNDDAVFYDNQLFDIDGSANYFDDLVRWKTKDLFDQDVGGTLSTTVPSNNILGMKVGTASYAAQVLTTSYADGSGLTIDYTPKSSGSKILVSFDFHAKYAGGTGTVLGFHYKLTDENNADYGTDTKGTKYIGDYGSEGREKISFLLDSWGTTTKTLKLRLRGYSTYMPTLNQTWLFDGTGSSKNVQPVVTVTEIGAAVPEVGAEVPACDDGKVLKADGGQWICGNDDDDDATFYGTTASTITNPTNIVDLTTSPSAKYIYITGTCTSGTSANSYANLDLKFSDALLAQIGTIYNVCYNKATAASTQSTIKNSLWIKIPSTATKITITPSTSGTGAATAHSLYLQN